MIVFRICFSNGPWINISSENSLTPNKAIIWVNVDQSIVHQMAVFRNELTYSDLTISVNCVIIGSSNGLAPKRQ